jgi:Zn-dependent peptidase ImmA (M78 family)
MTSAPFAYETSGDDLGGAVSRSAAMAATALLRSARLPEDGGRVPLRPLTKFLGLTICERPGLKVAGRWSLVRYTEPLRLWSDASDSLGEISLQPGLPESRRRFVIAHELGHVALYMDPGWAPRPLSLYWRERFASQFAAALLVPERSRPRLRREFRACTTVRQLLRVGASVGVSSGFLLALAHDSRWNAGQDQIWIDVRWAVNRYRGTEPRLRVHRAYLDPRRWFVAYNQSLRRLLRGGPLERSASGRSHPGSWSSSSAGGRRTASPAWSSARPSPDSDCLHARTATPSSF